MRSKLFFWLMTLFLAAAARGQTTAFTYQGQLNVAGHPANGNYDLSFQLVDINTNIIAGPVTNSPVWVTNGFFTVMLDFGGAGFDGSQRWLALGVRGSGEPTVPFTLLQPFQPLTPVPYALHAQTSEDAATALLAVTNQINIYSNTIAPVLAAAVKNSSTYTNLPYVTVSPHGIADGSSTTPNCGLMFGIDTPGTLTGGLQEAINALNVSATNTLQPAGGKIEVAAGTLFTSATVNFTGANCTYVLAGQGLSASGIVYLGCTNSAIYGSQPAGSISSTPNLFIRDLFIAASNDFSGFVIHLNSFGRFHLEDSWIGYYPVMQDGFVGFTPPTVASQSARLLIGLYLEGNSGDDIATISDNSFNGLATGLINDADHSVVANNMFSSCGLRTAIPDVTLPSGFGPQYLFTNLLNLASLGVDIVQGHSVHEDDVYLNNYFYEGHYAYAMDDGYDNGGVVSFRDGFEAMDGDMFLSPQSQFLQIDSHTESGPGAPNSGTINNVYYSGTAPYTAQSSLPTGLLTQTLNTPQAVFRGFSSFNFGNAAVNLAAASTLAGNGAALTSLNAAQLQGTAPLGILPGLTTNYTLGGGPTLYITNGVIMKIH